MPKREIEKLFIKWHFTSRNLSWKLKVVWRDSKALGNWAINCKHLPRLWDNVRSFSILNEEIVLEKNGKRLHRDILNKVLFQFLQEIGTHI